MTLEEILNELPENRPIYKDSGSWSVRNENLDQIFCQQDCSETFEQFIRRYYDACPKIDWLTDNKTHD